MKYILIGVSINILSDFSFIIATFIDNDTWVRTWFYIAIILTFMSLPIVLVGGAKELKEQTNCS